LQARGLPPMQESISEKSLVVPDGLVRPRKQEAVDAATFEVLKEIAKDVREGLLETVGVESEFSIDRGRCSMILKLPPETDTAMIASAIALENADAWCDENHRVNLGISPSFSTKDVDQTVLCAIKVIHVMLGLHAVGEVEPRPLKQRFIQSIYEILQIQQAVGKR
jgi:hypothetical protein